MTDAIPEEFPTRVLLACFFLGLIIGGLTSGKKYQTDIYIVRTSNFEDFVETVKKDAAND